MDVQELSNERKTVHLKIIFSVNNNPGLLIKHSSKVLISKSFVTIQLKAITIRNNFGGMVELNSYIFFKASQVQELASRVADHVLSITSEELKLDNELFPYDNDRWFFLYETKQVESIFNIKFSIKLNATVPSFSLIHDDKDLTDFELRGLDGSVQVHSAVLACSSPVFKRMLSGKWRETTESRVLDVQGAYKSTLKHLKDFMYLGTLPDTGLEHLLLLASLYMMPDLECRCIDNIVNNLTAKNVVSILEFALKHKMTDLYVSILECIQRGDVIVSDILKHESY